MARYIDADKVKTHFDANTWQGEFMIAMCDVTETEDVAPIIHAEWLPMTNPIEWTDGREHFECSNCGIYHSPLKNERYCPYCGARMSK